MSAGVFKFKLHEHRYGIVNSVEAFLNEEVVNLKRFEVSRVRTERLKASAYQYFQFQETCMSFFKRYLNKAYICSHVPIANPRPHRSKTLFQRHPYH